MASGVRIQVRDHGYEKLLAAAKAAAKGASVSVGVHAAQGAVEHEPEPGEKNTRPVTVLDIATWNEFGMGVPERSFIRAWFDEATAENRAALKSALGMVLRGEKTLEEALTLVGLRFVGKMQQRIAAGISPANAPATIQRKGSSKPLIDTGQLRQSLTFSVNGAGKTG